MMKNTVVLLAGILAIGCSQKPREKKPDILSANLDATSLPQQDFFQYTSGGWIKNNPIPSAETSWGIGQMVQDEIYLRLTKINESAANATSSDPIQKKIGNFWASGMDTVQIENIKFENLVMCQ